MGCDIHCIVEKKGNDGMWKAIKGQGCLIKMCKEHIHEAVKQNNKDNIDYYTKRLLEYRKSHGLSIEWIFDDRHYELFALLADVRNYDEWPALFAGRGLPPHPSTSTQSELKEWDSDAHSLTYFSLKDIKDAKWDQKVIRTAVVEDGDWNEFLQHPDWKWPHCYCMWTSSTTAHERSWELTYRDIADRFFKIVVSKMEKLARHSLDGDEGVRLVVFFDN